MKPLVSVIIPVYNSRDYLAETIQSVLDQSPEAVEIIAVNDGSTDGSLEVLQSFGDRIRLVSQKNSGQGAARNRALAMASGDFVYFMDSDDWIDRNTLESCVARCLKDNLDFIRNIWTPSSIYVATLEAGGILFSVWSESSRLFIQRGHVIAGNPILSLSKDFKEGNISIKAELVRDLKNKLREYNNMGYILYDTIRTKNLIR